MFKIPLHRTEDNIDEEGLEALYQYSDLTNYENFQKFLRRIEIIEKDLKKFIS